jgi:basic amino acid/polyamine antiporter, APA family
MNRRKTLAQAQDNDDGDDFDTTTSSSGGGGTGLRRSLTAVDLILYGVGSSVGAGIFVLVGIGAKIAGPAIAVSFLSCGLACILTSLAYSEFASLIPASGSAFTYTYVAFGEFYAFCVGWNLILGYGFTAAVVARAWGDYTGDLLVKVSGGAEWIFYLAELPIFGTAVDYTCSPLSIVIIGISTLVLLQGARESSNFSNAMTILNLGVLLLVIVSGLSTGSVSAENLTPFSPHGLPGILQGAGLVFFAFIGFDMVASLSEEVVQPERSMPIGIVGSLVASSVIYVTVSLAVVGMAPFRYLGETIPVVNALMTNACCSHEQQMEYEHVNECLRECSAYRLPVLATVGHIVSGGAIFGLTSACFTSLMGQPRIFYRMAKDGLWFPGFARVNPETQVMTEGILVTGLVAALLACFVPLEALANLISLGTLMVFTFVDAGVILLRMQNIAEAKFETIQHPQQRDEEKKRVIQEYENVVVLLLVFTTSLLGASIIFANTSWRIPTLLLVAVGMGCGMFIYGTPSSWTTKHRLATQGHSHHSFQCPFVPFVPLVGAAFNCFMMGSLPLSSWILCILWLSVGVVVYFSYGIHHSTLGQSSRYDENLALIEDAGRSAGDVGGYESTMNIPLEEK